MFELSVVARNKIFKPLQSILKKIKPGASKWNFYEKDQASYATQRSVKLLKRFTDPCDEDEDQMKTVMDSFLETAKDTLDKLILEIPNKIRANQNLLGHVAKCKRESLATNRAYEEMMKELEVLKRTLAGYGAGYIFVEDFKPDELQILDPNDATGRSSLLFKMSDFLSSISSSQTNHVTNGTSRALWTAHQKGLLKKENTDENVLIKIYLPCCKIEKCYHEIAKLR